MLGEKKGFVPNLLTVLHTFVSANLMARCLPKGLD